MRVVKLIVLLSFAIEFVLLLFTRFLITAVLILRLGFISVKENKDYRFIYDRHC